MQDTRPPAHAPGFTNLLVLAEIFFEKNEMYYIC